MDVTTLFLQSDGQKLRQEFRQLVSILTGRVPTSVSNANVLLQDKRMHEARKLGATQQTSIESAAPELLSYCGQLGLLAEKVTATENATVLLLGARVTAILKRTELLLQSVRSGALRPQGPVHLLTSVRSLEADELVIVEGFPRCSVAPTLELPGPIPGPTPATEADLIEGIYKMVFKQVALLRGADYHISIHPSPTAGTVDCARRWGSTALCDVSNVVAVSGPQPWGVYQALAVARGLRGAKFERPVDYIAYAPAEQPSILAVVEAFAKTVYEATLS